MNMNKIDDSFRIHLSSNSSCDIYPGNKLSTFRNLLPCNVDLTGNWEVAITNLTYPRKIFNVVDGHFDFYYHNYKAWMNDCKVPVGAYDTVADLVHAMQKAIFSKKVGISGGTVPTFFKYRLNDSSVMVFLDRHTRFRNMSDDLFYILGCHKETSGYTEGYVDMPHLPVDINRFHQIFIYCDFVEPQIVGNTLAPLLQSVPLFQPQQVPPLEITKIPGGVLGYGATVTHNFNPLQYTKVSKQTLGSALIELRTDIGELVPFRGEGRTNITLRFRRIES